MRTSTSRMKVSDERGVQAQAVGGHARRAALLPVDQDHHVAPHLQALRLRGHGPQLLRLNTVQPVLRRWSGGCCFYALSV